MDATVMTLGSVEIKQLALKIFLLNQSQREAIEVQMTGLPRHVLTCLDELNENFPNLHRLSKAQRESIYTNLISTAKHSDWDLLKEHMLSFDRLNSQFPSKLHAIIRQHRG